jgi:hypothetical protein
MQLSFRWLNAAERKAGKKTGKEPAGPDEKDISSSGKTFPLKGEEHEQ